MVNGNARPEIKKAVAPDGFAAVTVTGVPVALNVTVCDELVVPSGTEPKFRLLGETARPAPIPMSVIAGVFEALLVNESVPDTLPVATGEKVTLNPCV